jgi:DNA-binding transcriptional LysR family regulator
MRYFVGVAEELHFGRAAERLYISTPTLSQQIKQLEREVGTTLLIRHSRGVELTPAGQVFLARARETIQAAGLALKDTRRAVGLDEPVLRLGLLNGIPGWVDTPIWQDVAGDATADTLAAMAARLPVGRIGRTKDIAGAIIALLRNGFITGTVLHADGGHRLV